MYLSHKLEFQNSEDCFYLRKQCRFRFYTVCHVPVYRIPELYHAGIQNGGHALETHKAKGFLGNTGSDHSKEIVAYSSTTGIGLTLPARVSFCHLLMIFGNSLDPGPTEHWA